MSRIDRDACTVLDIEWYGIDRKGNMGVFCSGGVGNVPEFVCENVEETDLLIKWFDQLEKSTRGIVHHKMAGYAVQVAKVFSEKGLYYFDSDDGTKFGECNCNAYYTKVASPEIPLKYDCLPAEVKVWLSSHFLDVDDFARTEIFLLSRRLFGLSMKKNRLEFLSQSEYYFGKEKIELHFIIFKRNYWNLVIRREILVDEKRKEHNGLCLKKKNLKTNLSKK